MDTDVRHSSWHTWMTLYGQAWNNPYALDVLACPECHRTGGLRLVFHPGASPGVASGSLGCGMCLTGVGLCRVPVPGWATPVAYDDAQVPNYRLRPPV